MTMKSTRKPSRRRRRGQAQLFEYGDEAYYAELPPFTSSPEEIRLAVEQNALDRGILLIRVMRSQQLDSLLAEVDALARQQDKEELFEAAAELRINPLALAILDRSEPPVPYTYYFCTPAVLIGAPRLIFYYRNIAMLSLKVMRGIGMDTSSYERKNTTLDEKTATKLAGYFNHITSALVLEAGVSPYRHLIMMSANLGDAYGGTSRNEVGRVAMVRLMEPLIRHLHVKGHHLQINYSLKGAFSVPEEDEEDTESVSASKRIQLVHEIKPGDDVEPFLRQIADERVLYREIILENGSKLLLNRQVTWTKPEGGTTKVGPDLHTVVADRDMYWAAELKGGADPAGSDEHWKTATKALDRILEASEQTGRSRPMLSFIATILVERVAFEAQDWIDQGKLTTVYNLTKIQTDADERARYLGDMLGFLGCADLPKGG